MTQTELRSKLWSVGTNMLLGSSIMFGHELGLFTALSQQPYTAEQLATALQIDTRYTVEWCIHMYSNGFVSLNDETQQYYMTDEQQNCLLDESSNQYVFGLIQFTYGCNQLHPLLLQQWKLHNTKNNGVHWNDLNDNITHGLQRWFNVNYTHLLRQYWIPCISSDILDNMHSNTSANIADVGCGLGSATIQLATYFTNANVYGYDYDAKSLNAATELAKQHNLTNLHFEQSDAQSFKLSANNKFDLIFFFAAFHDMSNPGTIIEHCKSVLSSNGAVILIEPYAADTLEQTCKHPAAQLFAGVSLHYCTACAKNYTTDGMVMGAIQSNSVYRKLWIEQGGFKTMRMLEPKNTPANRLFEIRP